MNRTITNTLAAVMIGGVLVVVGCWHGTVTRQNKRIQLGSEYLPQLTNVVCSRSEFRDVRISISTVDGGCFLVSGMVGTEKQHAELESVVASTKPPLSVKYHVKVLEGLSDAKQ